MTTMPARREKSSPPRHSRARSTSNTRVHGFVKRAAATGVVALLALLATQCGRDTFELLPEEQTGGGGAAASAGHAGVAGGAGFPQSGSTGVGGRPVPGNDCPEAPPVVCNDATCFRCGADWCGCPENCPPGMVCNPNTRTCGDLCDVNPTSNDARTCQNDFDGKSECMPLDRGAAEGTCAFCAKHEDCRSFCVFGRCVECRSTCDCKGTRAGICVAGRCSCWRHEDCGDVNALFCDKGDCKPRLPQP